MRLNRLGGIIGKGSLQCSAMQLVLLGGELGEKYGTRHEYYNLRTPADAIKLLCVNYPEFQRDLVTAHERGVGYKVIKGLPMEDYDEINLPFGSKPLMLVPVITGSGGGGVGQILLGVGLVAASFLLPGAGLFGTTGLITGGVFGTGAAATAGVAGALTTIGTAFSAIGAGLILTGTANLISPQPEIPKLGNNRIGSGTRAQGTGPQGITRGASGEQSYLFTGPANTVGAGATVPVIYGRVITGSHLIASTIETVDDSDPHLFSIGEFSKNSILINSEKVPNGFRSLGGLNTRRINDNFQMGSDDSDKRRRENYEFGPNLENKVKQGSGGLQQTGGDLDYKKDKVEKLDVIFRLEDGLYRQTGGNNGVRYAGFISYTIEVVLSQSGADATVATASATIQGLFNNGRSDPYTYVHRLRVSKTDAGKGEDLRVVVRVTDAECRENTKFKFIGYGYDLA